MIQTQLYSPLTHDAQSEERFYLQIWEALNQPNDLVTESFCYPTHLSRGKIEKYLTENTNYNVIKLGSATPEEKQFLEQNQLSVKVLKSLHHKDNWEQQKGYLADLHPEKPVKINQIECLKLDQDIAFQQALVNQGYLYTICPFTGQTIRSNQSFFWGHFIGIYRCVGEQVFYLIAGQESFRKIFAYFPHTNLILKLSSSALNPIKLINKWRSYVIANWQTVISYLNFSETRPKVTLLGFRDNVAHCCYNELAGIDLLRQTGRLNQIDKFIVGCNTYFGSLEDLFPEIPPEKIINVISETDKLQLQDKLLEQQYFAFKYCNRRAVISEELAQRIYQAALNKCSQSTLSQIEAAKQHFPLIWIDIRVHKRAWISQVEGIANLLRQLAQDYPNLGVVFQGMALPETVEEEDDLSKQQKQQMIEQDHNVVQQIIDHIPQQEIAMYNGIGCMMYESLVWANTIDFYIAPWGAGLTRLTLIANKPGIIHTNHYTVESNIVKNWFSASHRENGISPIFISSDSIHVLEGSGGDKRHDDSYECDWREIYQQAVSVVETLNKQ